MALVLNCWESASVVGSTLTIDKPKSSSTYGDAPKNAAVGDLLVIVIGSDDNSSTAQWNDNPYKPTGFTFINEVGDSTRDCHCASFYKVVDGTEGSSFDVPTQSSDDLWGSCILISGNPSLHLTGADCVDSTPPISITGVTCTEADCLAFYLAAYDGGDDGGFSVSGTGWEERAEVRTGTGSGNGAGCWGTRKMSGTGATGTAIVSVGLSDGMVGFQFAIAPSEIVPEFVYEGNLGLSALPSSTRILDMVYVGAIGLTLLTSSARAMEYPYAGSSSVALTPASIYSLQEAVVEYEYFGVLTLGLLPSYSSVMEYPFSGALTTSVTPSYESILDAVYAGALDIALTPSHTWEYSKDYIGNLPIVLTPTYTSIVDRVYGGSLPVVLSPSHALIVDRIYDGGLPLMLLPESVVVRDAIYGGSIPVVLVPDGKYNLEEVSEFVYAGALVLALVPSYTVIRNYVYLGNIGIGEGAGAGMYPIIGGGHVIRIG